MGKYARCLNAQILEEFRKMVPPAGHTRRYSMLASINKVVLVLAQQKISSLAKKGAFKHPNPYGCHFGFVLRYYPGAVPDI